MEQFETILGHPMAKHFEIGLPIGISFYIFQAMSYMIDVYRGRITARERFRDVSLYISFFPQLVAGPIVRAQDFMPQLDRDMELTADNLYKGLQIFLWGLFKKVVVADRLAVCVDAVWASPGVYSTASVWCAAISYMLQILCDFSGYSDMAIGIARMFGFYFPVNFDLPYISQNPTDFWRRWHISLSTWLRDYLYIPMGGNRKGEVHTYVNLMLTMLLGGLWHGANWTFVVWGGCHGAALVAHKLYTKHNKAGGAHNTGKFTDLINIVLTDLFVVLCWVIFRSQDLVSALLILRRLFIPCSGIFYIYTYTVVFVILAVLFYILAKRKGDHLEYSFLDLSKGVHIFILFLFIWIIAIFGYFGSNAFIYFRF